MAAEKTKRKRLEIAKPGHKAEMGTAPLPTDEYSEILELVGRPLDCIINLVKAMPTGDFMMMEIEERRVTVPFAMSNGSYSYKTVTHILRAGDFSFGLECSRYGEVELYRLGEKDGDICDFVAKKKVALKIVDPMFAFTSSTYIYVVFNEPSSSAIAAGVKSRKPVQSDEDELLVIASGRPRAVRIDVASGEVKTMLPRTKSLPRYVAGLIDDPRGDIPMLMVANVLIQTSKESDEERPSFREMLSHYLSDEEDILPIKEEPFPVGISVARMGAGEKFVSVPMSGDRKFGITSVSLSEGTVDNTIRFSSGGDRATEGSFISELSKLNKS